MKIESIGVSNFQMLTDININLAGTPICLIAGANEQGKSSLHEAIRFALTGDEANNIAASLLAETVHDAPGIFSGNKRGYQLAAPVVGYRAIPPAVRTQIEQSLIRRGVKPTQDMVRNEYHAATQAIGGQ